jgi:glycine/D-amino acid oxidase-like deaminating enzyme
VIVKLFPADAHNQRTINQGHPPNWQNPPGGNYDLVVLGGGPAGLIAALTAVVGGHRVAMTEKLLTGGTCVNFGCTPSKALSAAPAQSTRPGGELISPSGSTHPRKSISPRSWNESAASGP